MKIFKRSLQALLSSAPRSRVLARLASLAQIGELARRLWISRLCDGAKYLWTASFTLYKLATKNLHLATIFLQLVANRRPEDFLNFEPCQLYTWYSSMWLYSKLQWCAIYRSLEFKLNFLSCQKLDYLPGQQALILDRSHKLRFRVRHKREIKNEKNNQSQQTYTVNTKDYLTGIN